MRAPRQPMLRFSAPHRNRKAGSSVCAACQTIWRIDVENFPAIIGIGDKGHDFFKEPNLDEPEALDLRCDRS